MHKSLFAHCVDQAIDIGNNELGTLCDAARDASIRVMTGCIERDRSRGQSVFAPLVTVDDQGAIRNVHRKIMPIYEERLVWSPGDGAGLKTYEFGRFRLGGLNCWENWMPLARSALYAHGEDLHDASWPGSARKTGQITPFIAREARSFVLSASSLMRREDIPDRIPHAELLRHTWLTFAPMVVRVAPVRMASGSLRHASTRKSCYLLISITRVSAKRVRTSIRSATIRDQTCLSGVWIGSDQAARHFIGEGHGE